MANRRFRPATIMVVLLLVAVPGSAAIEFLDERFENGVAIFDSGDNTVYPLADGHVGSGLLSKIPQGSNWGSRAFWNFSAHGFSQPEELWWRYYVKFPTGFYIEPPLRGKLPGPANLGPDHCNGSEVSTSSIPCWSLRTLFSRDYTKDDGSGYQDGPEDEVLLGYYPYHLPDASSSADGTWSIWTWDEDVATLQHDTWYCVEGHVRLNTPGVNDGLVEGFVDGVEAFRKDDVGFRRATEENLTVKTLWFDVYYGRDDPAYRSTKYMEIHFDSLALSGQRIGCADPFNGTFLDDDGHLFEADIEWLADSGITRGCNPPTNDRFCPDSYVTRGQMAAFLVRALDLTDSGTVDFVDDDGHLFEADIEKLATAEITRGCNPPTNDRFCPDSRVTRGQMAAFLHRASGLMPAP